MPPLQLLLHLPMSHSSSPYMHVRSSQCVDEHTMKSLSLQLHFYFLKWATTALDDVLEAEDVIEAWMFEKMLVDSPYRHCPCD